MARIPLVHRFRFSLRTFFVTLFVLSLISSNLYVSWRWDQSREEIQRLRDELGYLTIDDPKRFYVREVPTFLPFSWRWRIYVPPGNRNFFLATGGIEKTGTQAGYSRVRGIQSPADPMQGEFTLSVRVERGQNGGWELVATYPDGRMMLDFKPSQAGWVFNDDHYPAVRANRNNARSEVAGLNGKTESFSADEPVVLLRLRAPEDWKTDNGQPCDGAMVWFEKPRSQEPKGTSP